jgi:hypothetical protein
MIKASATMSTIGGLGRAENETRIIEISESDTSYFEALKKITFRIAANLPWTTGHVLSDIRFESVKDE